MEDAQASNEDARKMFDAIGSRDKTLKVFTADAGGAQALPARRPAPGMRVSGGSARREIQVEYDSRLAVNT
jgi:hypothetical protein